MTVYGRNCSVRLHGANAQASERLGVALGGCVMSHTNRRRQLITDSYLISRLTGRSIGRPARMQSTLHDTVSDGLTQLDRLCNRPFRFSPPLKCLECWRL